MEDILQQGQSLMSQVSVLHNHYADSFVHEHAMRVRVTWFVASQGKGSPSIQYLKVKGHSAQYMHIKVKGKQRKDCIKILIKWMKSRYNSNKKLLDFQHKVKGYIWDH